ncbi:MAG: ATP-binding cassette domain-containing protein [Candidatus Dojkabacteria bacterium]|jgi:ABC-type multidrug transport system fused ATPase/permease subunit
MVSEKLRKKLITLWKVLSFVYSKYTYQAVSRDLLCIVAAFGEIASITFFGKFIDTTTKIFLEWESFNLTEYMKSDSFFYLLLVLLLWVVFLITTQARAYLYDSITEKITKDSQIMMISKVASSNMQDVEKEDYQDMITYAPTFSVNKIAPVYDYFSVVISDSIRLTSALAIIFSTMGCSVVFILLIILPETLVVHIKRRKIRKYQDESVGKLKFLSYIQNLALGISNFLELRVNNIFSYLKRKHSSEYDEYQKGYLENLSNFYMDKTATSVVGQTLKFAYVLYVLAVSIVKKISFGTFKALYDYVDVAYNSIYNILNSISLVSINLGYIDKFFDLIEYDCFGDRYHGEKKLKNKTPLLEFKKLTFAYPDDPMTTVLKNLNISVEPGEKVAFLGGDGSGKSTVVKILTGLYTVEKGEYLLDGIPTKDLDRGELKKKVSVIFQDYINYNFSVKENVVISGQRINVDSELYEKVIKISGVEKFKKKVKIDDSSILGKIFPSGKDLSPGYWQQLAIARMLYRNRNIFVMDEPFTHIDDISAGKILENIFKFVGDDRSVIYITRRTKFLNRFDKVYHFENGKIVENGKWSDKK